MTREVILPAHRCRYAPAMDVDRADTPRFEKGSTDGHYESWFLRANHPERPDAFWIRYTIFAPKNQPERAEGELWAIAFRAGKPPFALKTEIPMSDCHFGSRGLDVRVGDARLWGEARGGTAEGRLELDGRSLRWRLRFDGARDPLCLLAERLYDAPLPKAKALVPRPGCRFTGELVIDGESMEVHDWHGSQNHNWGSKHTDEYAWGQVVGFEGDPDAFLEVSTARIHLGPVKTPWLTPMVLREGGREHHLGGLLRAARNDGSYELGRWTFAAMGKGIQVEGTFSAPPDSFVALPYRNPPGGLKTCLNAKVARCELSIRRRGERPRRLVSPHGAAFEILRDARPGEHPASLPPEA